MLKEFIKLNVNTDTMYKKCETCRIKYKDCMCSPEYTSFKDNLIKYKYLCCNKNQKKFDESLKKRFLNTYNFSNHDINKNIKKSTKLYYLKNKIFTVT